VDNLATSSVCFFSQLVVWKGVVAGAETIILPERFLQFGDGALSPAPPP
jgi:hypothetical protein